MKVIDKIRASENDVVFSFEFFPPKTEEGVENLFEKMERMVANNPTFCDITWGAGGSTADLTLEIANRMQNMVCVETMMHLTCTNMGVDKIDDALDTIKNTGIQNVLALRGDPPHGQDKFVQAKGGFSCALHLVSFISFLPLILSNVIIFNCWNCISVLFFYILKLNFCWSLSFYLKT